MNKNNMPTNDEAVFLWGPIQLKWYSGIGMWKRWFHWHACEAAHDMFNRRTFYCWTYHLGPLKVYFGYPLERPLQELFNAGMLVHENQNSGEGKEE